MSSNTFSQHSLFKKNIQISSKSDLINDQLNKHGEKIILDIALSDIESMPQVRKNFEVDKVLKEILFKEALREIFDGTIYQGYL